MDIYIALITALNYLIRIIDTIGLYIDDFNSSIERKSIVIDEIDKKLFDTKLKEGLKQVDEQVQQKKRKAVESVQHLNTKEK